MTVVRSATQLTLPWPPSVNGYWIPTHIGGGRVVNRLSKRATEYRREVIAALRVKFGPVPPRRYEQPVRVDLELRVPDRRARDIDNHVKGLFDALTHAGIWADDVLVDELTVRRGRQLAGGAAEVLIAALDPLVEPIPNDVDPDLPPPAAKR